MRIGDLRHPRQAHYRHVIDQYHRWIYNDDRLYQTSWLGVRCQKLPLDLWTYQEIVVATRPSLIIETGTMHGGSALFLASVCDLIDHGRVVSVDIETRNTPDHRRITFLKGRSSTDPQLLDEIRAAVDGETVMVILDSDHSERHVSDELGAYAPLVTPGCHLVVEDTNVNGHPVLPDHGPGPMEAIDRWAPLHPEFERTTLDERFLVSLNPRGFFRRR